VRGGRGTRGRPLSERQKRLEKHKMNAMKPSPSSSSSPPARRAKEKKIPPSHLSFPSVSLEKKKRSTEATETISQLTYHRDAQSALSVTGGGGKKKGTSLLPFLLLPTPRIGGEEGKKKKQTFSSIRGPSLVAEGGKKKKEKGEGGGPLSRVNLPWEKNKGRGNHVLVFQASDAGQPQRRERKGKEGLDRASTTTGTPSSSRIQTKKRGSPKGMSVFPPSCGRRGG